MISKSINSNGLLDVVISQTGGNGLAWHCG